MGGNCNAGVALSRCKTSLFVGPNRGVTRVLVVLLAGKSSDDVKAPANSLKTAGIKIITVGMGASVDQSQLSSMKTPPSNVLKVPSFDRLADIRERLTNQISQGISFKVQDCLLCCMYIIYRVSKLKGGRKSNK